MNMNQYWEKYKNRNKSQDHLSPPTDKFESNPILDTLSSLQSQINSLEDKFLDLHCRVSNKAAYESHFPSISFEKIEKLEKSLEYFSIFNERIAKLEENNSFFRYENLRMDLIKELNLTENKINDFLSSELASLNKKIKGTKSNSVRFEGEPEKLDSDWQKKIEKIVVICAEKLKNLEDRPAGSSESPEKLKKFRAKVNKRIEELEEFTKKVCRKIINLESASNPVSSPLSKHYKNDSNQSFSKKGADRLKKTEQKKVKSRSTSPTGKEAKQKCQNKLEKLYKELKDI